MCRKLCLYRLCMDGKPQIFEFQIGVFLPEHDCVPRILGDMMDDQMSYYVEQVPLNLLTETDFIKGFVQAGSLCMISYGTCIDSDDCVAVTPEGMLVMSLCKDTYQRCGLDGHLSKAGKNIEKFVVKVDLKSDKFYPGTKYYDRVQWCLSQMANFDFLVTWIPNDGKVCPSSIQNFFKTKSIQCNRLKVNKTNHEFKNFNIPIIDPAVIETDSEQKSCNYDEVFEWLGACAVGIDDYEGDDYLSTYSCPTPNKQASYCIYTQYEGIIHPSIVKQYINYLRQFMKDKKLPWSSVTVHGFVDSPLSWIYDHGFHNNGDNIYTFLMFPNDEYWLYRAIGGQDICP
ncbi:Ribonuclease P protein subunit p40 [Mactra antiquata]